MGLATLKRAPTWSRMVMVYMDQAVFILFYFFILRARFRETSEGLYPFLTAGSAHDRVLRPCLILRPGRCAQPFARTAFARFLCLCVSVPSPVQVVGSLCGIVAGGVLLCCFQRDIYMCTPFTFFSCVAFDLIAATVW